MRREAVPFKNDALMDREKRIVKHRRPAQDEYEWDYGNGRILMRGDNEVYYMAKQKRTGAFRMLRQQKKDDVEISHWYEEVETMSRCDHPHVVKLFETFEDDNHSCQIVELCNGRDLARYIEAEKPPLPETTVSVLIQQMLSAVAHLHSLDICHGKLRPDCFFFTRQLLKDHKVHDMCLKLIDFGRARRILSTTTQEVKPGESAVLGLRTVASKAILGYEFAAPEQLAYQDPWSICTSACDVWAIGATAYHMLSGGYPEPRVAPPSTWGPSDSPALDPPDVWRAISSAGHSFTLWSLIVSPERRPTSKQLMASTWMTRAKQVFVGAVKTETKNEYKNPTRNVLDSHMGVDAVAQGFKNMARMTPVQRAAVTAVAHSLPEEKVRHLRLIFAKMDLDGDGCLTAQEIKAALQDSRIGLGSKVNDALKMIDTDGSGVINYTEFVAATFTNTSNLREEIREAAFQIFDTDQSGSVSKDEIKHLLNTSNMQGMVDEDKDGHMDESEFQELLRMTQPDAQQKNQARTETSTRSPPSSASAPLSRKTPSKITGDKATADTDRDDAASGSTVKKKAAAKKKRNDDHEEADAADGQANRGRSTTRPSTIGGLTNKAGALLKSLTKRVDEEGDTREPSPVSPTSSVSPRGVGGSPRIKMSRRDKSSKG